MSNKRQKVLLFVSAVFLTILLGAGLSAQAAAPDLFFSEYIEGSSFNKAVEIYNGTGSAVDLSTYILELYSNGAASPSQSVALSGTLADGDVFVIAHGSADPAILAVADATSSTVINFNGDDALVLRNNGDVADSFGQVGFDPGSEWTGGGQDDTLRRDESVCAGDTNPGDTFDASAEWIVFANNTFDGLGSHNANCNGGGGPSDPVINEFVFNHTGTDTEAFIEVFGDPGTNYSTYTVLEIEGDSSGAGTIDAVLPIGTTNAGGYWTDDEDVENGTVTLLLVEGFSGSSGDDLDTDNDGALDTTPWGRVVDDVAVSDGGTSDQTYSTTVLDAAFDGGTFTVGGASRIPNGTDTDSVGDWVRNDFDLFGIPGFPGSPALGEAENTPGAVNVAITVITDPFGVCGDPATLIHDIQGSGLASGDVGSVREVEAVVVATFQGPDQIGGYFVQEEDTDADADPLTSEGLRVFDTSNTPLVGDVVRIRGSVTEFFDLTELNNIVDFEVCGSGTATPATVSLPVTSIDDFERFEGMAVTFPQTLYISEYFNFDRFGEIVLTTDRQFQPTATFEPGSTEAADRALANSLSRITLDDGRGNQNPDPAIHPNGMDFTLTNLFRGGDTVQNVTGVLDYNFGAYKIQPTQGADYTSANPRPAQPDDVGGNMKVASFNVLNYFTTLDDSGPICGPLEDQDCRGADDANEFTRQRDKIIAALVEINADVVGLIEIENHPADVPTADLVSGLNDVLGAGTYDYIVTGAIGSDAIRVAFIYKPASTTPVGDYAILDSSVDSRFLDDFNRPVLAQTFQDNSTGGIVTLAVNHLKSKGSPCDAIGDPNTGDGSGNCNLTRKAAAEALVDWLATDPTGSGDGDFLIMGDLNSYDKEDPIDAILQGSDDTLGNGDDYADLLFELIGEDAYSYVFDGQLGYLDHALANQELLPEVTGATIWHINADEPDLIDYDTSFKQDAQDDIYAPDAFRSSDHDPVIVGLEICDEIAPTLEVTASPDTLWPANHKYVTVQVAADLADNFDPNPSLTLLSVTSNEPDNGLGDGDKPNDIVVIDTTTIDLRAERSGNGNGRIYTLTYEATDACGNSSVASTEVFVPHSQGQQVTVDLQILAFNDYHGHLQPNTPGTVDGAAAGGSEYLSAMLAQLREGNKYSLTVAAGDLIGGSPAFSGLFHDEPSVESLNAMGLDVSSVGNHEFDEGVTELLRMQNGGCHPLDGCYFPSEPYPGANFQWLAANVVNQDGETPLPPYWVKTIEGVKVGFIGMTLEATDTLVAAVGIQGWDFLDEAETANALVPVLKAQGVEAIVVLLHEGGSQTPPPGAVDACVGISGPIVAINNALDPEIDALITGHTHLPYNCVLPDSDGQPRIVTSAYSYGRVVSELNLVLDKRTKDVRRDLSTATNHAVIQASLTPDPAMTAIIAKWQPLVDAAGSTPVGTITETIFRGGNPPGSDRGVESAAGNLVADAQLWATSSNFADVAFMNPGGVRSDLTYPESAGEGDGVVTFGEAFTFQPFGNTLFTFPMTGAQIVSVLEEQCQPAGSSRPFLHLGVSEGFTYDLAKTIVSGDCTSVSVSNVKLNGVDLNPSATYNVTVNNFLADGGDNFSTFATITAPRLDGGNDLLALVNYLGTFSPVAPPSIDRVNELP